MHTRPHIHPVRRPRGVLLAALVVGASVTLGPAVLTATAAPAASRTYTSDADFDEGTYNNVVHSTPGQLQLDETVTAFPFIWVALSGRGTIAKIDTSSGAVLGEYSTTSDGDGAHNPSRTTVGNDGSVWAGNRNQSSVIHIGLVEAGQCVDRNGNGTIETSSAYGDVLAWPGGSGGATAPVADAQDECILHYVDTAGSDARHVSVDAAGDIWVGDNGSRAFQKLDGATGAVEVPAMTMPCGGYGGLVDGNGVLWSAQSGSALLRWDPDAPTLTPGADTPDANPRCIPIPIYGLAFDSQNNVWATQYSGQRIWKVSPDGNTRQDFNQGNPNAQGVAVDGNDDVWVSSSLGAGTNTVAHLRNDGTLVGIVSTAAPGVAMGAGSTGVSVDSAGKIWTANYGSSTATRIDPTAGPAGVDGQPIGQFDLSVDLPGSSPYNYSDMTGSTLTGRPSSGSWTTVYDSGIADAEWGSLAWTADTPGTSTLTFTVASSADGVTFGPAETVTGPADLSVADGRYLRVTATFTRSADDESPVLFDLTVATVDVNEAPTAHAGGPYTVPEGSSTTLDASLSTDPDVGDELTYAWDLDDDGTFETTGATPTFSAVGLDGPGTAPVVLRACDEDGACDEADVTVSITNVAPTVDAGADQTVYRNDVVSLAGTWTDPAGALDDDYDWAWGAPATPAAGSAPYGSTAAATAVFATEGSYPLPLSVTDKDGGTGTDTVTVTVLNRAPVCAAAAPSESVLWPPDHRFVPISITGLTDAEDDELDVTVTSIRQDEPVRSGGANDTGPDGRGVGTATAEVRAERDGTSAAPGDGRVYHIAFTADDGHGGSCAGVVTVSVPFDRSSPAVDGGALNDSVVPGDPTGPTPSPTPTTPRPGSGLPGTGAETAGLAGGAALLLAVGLGLGLASRRRTGHTR